MFFLDRKDRAEVVPLEKLQKLKNQSLHSKGMMNSPKHWSTN